MRADWEKKIKKNEFILDIGCWDGKKVLELSQLSKNVYGIDINTKRFESANEKIREKLFFGDVTKKIPFNIKFDWIILSEVLEHVSDDSKTLSNISNSLKNHGKLILTTPKSIKFFEFWDPAWVRWKFLRGQRHYHYTKEELFQKLKENKFEIKDYYITGNWGWVLARWINVFFRYGLKSKKQIRAPGKRGFCDWIVLSEKIK
mgnify:CR=1 FL=1